MSCHPLSGRNARDEVERAKQLITIQEAWLRLGLRGQPSAHGACRSPFRPDETPSFSIFDDGRAFNDFGDPDAKGDVFGFVMKAQQCDFLTARNIIFGWCGFRPGYGVQPRPAFASHNPARAWRPKNPPRNLRLPTDGELDAYLKRRKLGDSLPGIREMVERGCLLAGDWSDTSATGSSDWRDVPVLIVTDTKRTNFMVRRQDGRQWRCLSGAKNRPWIAHQGMASWPIGAELLAAGFIGAPSVLLVEGFPDAIAAHVAAMSYYGSAAAMRHFVVVAMYSASGDIHPDALPLFKSRHVRIAYHTGDKGADGYPDPFDANQTGAGIRAAKRWASQLRHAGARVDTYELTFADGSGDLNDAVSLAISEAGECRPDFTNFFAGLPLEPLKTEFGA